MSKMKIYHYKTEEIGSTDPFKLNKEFIVVAKGKKIARKKLDKLFKPKSYIILEERKLEISNEDDFIFLLGMNLTKTKNEDITNG